MFPQLTWLASVVLFIVFASVSFYKVAIGADSCGCFGAVAVNPWYTFAFDVSVVITLLGCRPSKTGSMTQVQGWISFVFSWLILVLPVSYLLISYQSAQLTSDGVIHGNGMVLLSPEEWVGTHFSLSKHIQMYEKQSLFQGPWKVLLYRNQCEQCHQVIEDWKHADSANSQIAVISVPDVSETVSVSSSFPEHWLQGQLDSQISWAVTTPVVLILNDGIVHHVNVGEACFNRTE